MRVAPIVASCVIAAFQISTLGQSFKVGQWEVHEGLEGIVSNPPLTDDASRKAAFTKANIPPAGDPGWKVAETVSAADAAARYQRRSALKNTASLDFTYFQSIVTVPPGATINTFEVSYDQVDDGARVWIFNDRHPNGTFLESADMIRRANSKATADMKSIAAPGDNRVVIVQYDCAPVENNIRGIRVRLNGQEVKAPTEDQIGVTLFDGENFTGVKLPYGEGTHDIFSSRVGLNDLVSSVKVKAGWKVTLYEHFKLGGRNIELTSDTPSLKAKGFDNITSGVKIEKIK
jgi:hypothetical protein